MQNLHLIVTIDCLKGFKNEFGTVYPLNYGYIEGIMGGNEKKQNAYCIEDGDIQPRQFFEGYLIVIMKKNGLLPKKVRLIRKSNLLIKCNF
ncbi:hypothetical protein GA840_02340 [Pediococcus ethanolidurans]|uniref:hypothetical protein n=1 Tax=Pediococcus ethanolidurans TaxID=319653 RepID=UPI002955BE04|nr:hypothetical protein [Pediococcus ethanolidurans]MDV7718708.1 hypothetical protein [Pediococcus ethanolidurans]